MKFTEENLLSFYRQQINFLTIKARKAFTNIFVDSLELTNYFADFNLQKSVSNFILCDNKCTDF